MRGVVRSTVAARLGHSVGHTLSLLCLPGLRLVCAARAGPRHARTSRRRRGQRAATATASGYRAGRGAYTGGAGGRGRGEQLGAVHRDWDGELRQAARRPRPAHEHQRYVQCPMPNIQCPMPSAQFQMPNAQCPMPNAQMPDAQCSMPDAPLCVTGHWCTFFKEDPAGCNRHAVTFPNGSTALCQVKAGGGCESRYPTFVCPPPPPPAPPRPPPQPGCAALLTGRANGRETQTWCPAFKEDGAACRAHYMQEEGVASGHPKLCLWDQARSPACYASEAVACVAEAGGIGGTVGTGVAKQPAVAAAAGGGAAPSPAVAGAWSPGAPKESCSPLDGAADIDYLDCKAWCGPFDLVEGGGPGGHADHCLLCKCKGCMYCRQHATPQQRTR